MANKVVLASITQADAVCASPSTLPGGVCLEGNGFELGTRERFACWGESSKLDVVDYSASVINLERLAN
jgi:hypothetical protein